MGAILIGIAADGLCGAINGFLITVCRINSIITTIGTLSIFRGIAFVITDAAAALVDDEKLIWFGSDRAFGMPIAVWLILVIDLIVHVVATHTCVGRPLFEIQRGAGALEARRTTAYRGPARVIKGAPAP